MIAVCRFRGSVRIIPAKIFKKVLCSLFNVFIILLTMRFFAGLPVRGIFFYKIVCFLNKIGPF